MIIFLYGADTYRSHEKLNKLREKFSREIDKSHLNLSVLDGEKLTFEEFYKSVSAAPFLATKRMIIVKNLISKNKSKKIFEEIADYIKNKDMSQENIIVFWEEEGQSKKHGARGIKKNILFDLLKKEKYMQEFLPLEEWKLTKWIKEEIKKEGGTFEEKTVQLLIALAGNDLWQMHQEIEKLISFKKNRPITQEDINLLVSGKIKSNIFNLVDAMGTKNRKSALRLLNNELISGTSVIQLLGMIVRQFRILLEIKETLKNDSQISKREISLKLNLHPFVAQKALEQARNYTLGELKNIYKKLLSIDIKTKTTSLDPRALFNLFIAEITT